MTFSIVQSSTVRSRRKRYPPHGWPLDALHINEAFVIPMADGLDAHGRTETYVRLVIWKAGAKLRRTLSVNKLADGNLAVVRLS